MAYHFLLMVCSNNDSIFHRVRDIITITMYMTACQVKNTVKIASRVLFPSRRKRMVFNTCYISRGMAVRKVTNSKGDLHGHSPTARFF